MTVKETNVGKTEVWCQRMQGKLCQKQILFDIGNMLHVHYENSYTVISSKQKMFTWSNHI